MLLPCLSLTRMFLTCLHLRSTSLIIPPASGAAAARGGATARAGRAAGPGLSLPGPGGDSHRDSCLGPGVALPGPESRAAGPQARDLSRWAPARARQAAPGPARQAARAAAALRGTETGQAAHCRPGPGADSPSRDSDSAPPEQPSQAARQ
jgi:hypothetical protein